MLISCKAMTNGDLIRSMDDKCLAALLTGYVTALTLTTPNVTLCETFEADTYKWLQEEVTPK